MPVDTARSQSGPEVETHAQIWIRESYSTNVVTGHCNLEHSCTKYLIFGHFSFYNNILKPQPADVFVVVILVILVMHVLKVMEHKRD